MGIVSKMAWFGVWVCLGVGIMGDHSRVLRYLGILNNCNFW